MEFHRGRLVDHVQLRVAELKRSRDFYTAVLGRLGLTLEIDTAEAFGCDELYVSPAGVETPSAYFTLAWTLEPRSPSRPWVATRRQSPWAGPPESVPLGTIARPTRMAARIAIAVGVVYCLSRTTTLFTC